MITMALNRVSGIDPRTTVRNALVSVWDKSGLAQFASALAEAAPGCRFFSTGGTYTALQALPALKGRLVPISEYTGQPEMQGGLVKTLDFRIYLGLLSETDNPAHAADLERAAAVAFDLVVVNLYPFAEASSRPGADLEDARAHIDIGGPCMLRAAAKNFLRVAALCDPADYPGFVEELRSGRVSFETRLRLAAKVFSLTAAYDAGVAAVLRAAASDMGRSAAVYSHGSTERRVSP